MVGMMELIDFLLEAKKATYAGEGPELSPSRPSSHDLEFTRGNLQYIDTYLGSEKFTGAEAIWEKDKPLWAMNYAGRVTAEGFSGDFLKEALLHVPADRPFRGPEQYSDGHFTYTCTVNGDFGWFNGVEEIRAGGMKVYECMFHGGWIKE
ncbi:hypothetical protein JRJ22_06910 [Paenibacillus tianjinensis]|uniref:DUF5680 domain-containing protein n=2 Tax=Paenibacillus tianjinensis TaxID=2810347 RepID=A0ABX7LHR9_9BACL|nr:hypothetical protein JRJ22_06910 [Paenibacillus tianjinensis]